MKSYITKAQYQELQKFGEQHGITDEDVLFDLVKNLSYEFARNAIICWAICQGVKR